MSQTRYPFLGVEGDQENTLKGCEDFAVKHTKSLGFASISGAFVFNRFGKTFAFFMGHWKK